MKKFIAILLAVAMMAVCFAGCGSDSKSNDDAKTDSDLSYVQGKGKLVVGITDFEPMDYQDGSGNWIGFDADMATAFAKSIGVDVEFTEIDWDNKAMELDGKSIDCVWNGMTLNDEVKSAMSCSNAYCNNAQVVIVKAADVSKYQSAADCKDLKFAVESGSAGQKAAEANGYQFTEVKDQATALMEVKAGTCDAAIIDSLMAAAMVGEGTGYAELTYTAKLTSEEYGVGFRKGSDLTEKLNEFLAAKTADGTLKKIAEKYGIQDYLIGN